MEKKKIKKIMLSARIPEALKKSLDSFCEERGFKMERVVEDAVREHIDRPMYAVVNT